MEMGSDDADLSSAEVQALDAILDILVGQGIGPPPSGSAEAMPNAKLSQMLPLVRSATDSITINDLTCQGLGYVPTFGNANTVNINIQGSNIEDLGIALGTGANSLSIGTTTTTELTILVALSTEDTYTGLGGNSFADPIIIGFK